MKQLRYHYFIRALCAVGLLVLVFGRTEAAAVNLTIDATGPSAFTLFAVQMDNVSAMQIKVEYDSSTLQNPRVNPTGILLARSKTHSNTSPYGTVNISVKANDTLIGSGIIVALDFDLVSDEWPGKILSASAQVTDGDGKFFNVPVVVTNPPQQRIKRPKDEEEAGNVPAENASDATQAAPAPGSTPSEPRSDPSVHPAPVSESSPVDEKRPAKENNKPGELQNVKIVPGSGIFSRFAALPENNLLEALRQLVATGQGDAFTQDPLLALSDGSTLIKVTFRLSEDIKSVPTFIINGANSVSLDTQDNVWILKLLPHAGAEEVSVSVLQNNILHEYPLALAPPLDIHVRNRLSGAPWSRFDTYVKMVNILVLNGVSDGTKRQTD